MKSFLKQFKFINDAFLLDISKNEKICPIKNLKNKKISEKCDKVDGSSHDNNEQ